MILATYVIMRVCAPISDITPSPIGNPGRPGNFQSVEKLSSFEYCPGVVDQQVHVANQSAVPLALAFVLAVPIWTSTKTFEFPKKMDQV